MKTLSFIAALLVCITAAHGQVLLNFTDGDATPGAVTVNPGDTFSFDVSLQVLGNEGVLGITYFIESIDGAGFFTLTDWKTIGGFFDELQSLPSAVLDPSNALLDPANLADLGGINSNLDVVDFATGPVFVSTLTFLVDPAAAPGTYHITSTTSGGLESIWIDWNIDLGSIEMGSFEITVLAVPEPKAVGLAGVWLLGLCLVIRKRR